MALIIFAEASQHPYPDKAMLKIRVSILRDPRCSSPPMALEASESILLIPNSRSEDP
jgi:hypothetical protein